jgi:hypothetical protein
MAQTRKRSGCPPGTILRAGYVRTRKGRSTRVAAGCIRNVGAPGKGLPGGQPGIGVLRQGDLTQFGYGDVTHLTVGERHLALSRAVKKYGVLSVFRKLNAVYVYTRRSSPASSRIFKADRDWVKAHYGL